MPPDVYRGSDPLPEPSHARPCSSILAMTIFASIIIFWYVLSKSGKNPGTLIIQMIIEE